MERPPLSAFVNVLQSYLDGSLSDEDFVGAHDELWRQARDAGGMYPQPGAEHAINDVFDAIEGSWLTNAVETFSADWHFLDREELQQYVRRSLATLKPLVDAPESPDWPRQRQEVARERLAASVLERRLQVPTKGPIKPRLNPRMQMIVRHAEEEAERLGHYWVGTGHVLIALAADRHRKGHVTTNYGDPGYGDGLAVLDEIAPDWEEEVTERLQKIWTELEAVVERLQRERDLS